MNQNKQLEQTKEHLELNEQTNEHPQKHSEQLHEHSKQFNEHSEQLHEHSKQLHEHSEQLNEHEYKLINRKSLDDNIEYRREGISCNDQFSTQQRLGFEYLDFLINQKI